MSFNLCRSIFRHGYLFSFLFEFGNMTNKNVHDKEKEKSILKHMGGIYIVISSTGAG